MRERKHKRNYKRQLGQYMTPTHLTQEIVSKLNIESYHRILEPSCGDGSFLSAIIKRLSNTSKQDIEVTGIEIDPALAEKSCAVIENNLANKNLLRMKVIQADFFKEYLAASMFSGNSNNSRSLQFESFDLIIGNPPFGGSFDQSIEDILDTHLGKRLGKKIKKETYAFFIVACLDLLRLGGRLIFICSDTLITIPTMTGLRQLLMKYGNVNLHDINSFSDETNYPMLLLDFTKIGHRGIVTHNSKVIDSNAIQSTMNLSWGINPNLAQIFSGPVLGDYFVASSGMTTGKNELFVRKVNEQNTIKELYEFEFYNAPITLSYELERARLEKLSAKRIQVLRSAEDRGETERRIRAMLREKPLTVHLPDSRYRPYNKANSHILFSDPTHYIYWENEGDAVLTYKRTGNWYLRGVGGQPYFGKEGITWALISSKFKSRYIPTGYILDSGAPCAFARDGVDRNELFFALGWLLSSLANYILKTVINHTMNIQSKDFERMPYPWWISSDEKIIVINLVKAMIEDARKGKIWLWEDEQLRQLDNVFTMPNHNLIPLNTHSYSEQLTLLTH